MPRPEKYTDLPKYQQDGVALVHIEDEVDLTASICSALAKLMIALDDQFIGNSGEYIWLEHRSIYRTASDEDLDQRLLDAQKRWDKNYTEYHRLLRMKNPVKPDNSYALERWCKDENLTPPWEVK